MTFSVKSRRGIILFLVSIVIAMLAVGSLSLLALLTTEYEAAIFRGDEIQAGQLVQSGMEFLGQTLGSSESSSISETEWSNSFDSSGSFYFSQQISAEQSRFHRLYDNPVQFCGVEVVPGHWDRPSRGAGRFTVFSPRIEQDKLKGIRFGLVNESTRLHLGTVLEWETELAGQGSHALLKLPGMTPTMADSILDWIDADKTHRSSGAELDYYERIGVAYRPRNALPATLEELLLVRDVTRSLLFGTDEKFFYGADMNDLQRFQPEIDWQNDLLFQPREGVETINSMDSTEFSETNIPASFFDDLTGTNIETENGTVLPWCFLLTTLSAEKLVDPTGNAKIFLNDSNLEFLGEQLRGKLDEESCQFILAWRRNNGLIDDPVDLLDAVIEEKENEKELKSKSPFSLENSVGEEKFLTLLDVASVSSEIVVSGRINVNEAPQIVLETVPELDKQTVLQIVNRRGVPGEKRQGKYRHLIWLLSEKIVDKAMMKKLSKRLTTGGDVYRAQIIGFFDGQGTVNRAEVVIDATVKPPRPVFTKNLSSL
ncbi:MAG: general secretion pathway protein GspK [Planctomycetaceae bacterium]|jgi:DNA uptake protein ComE-like DNA-binding protein|nr:general secretion pathway protein GspK [Planctomycetaceae bacterium]